MAPKFSYKFQEIIIKIFQKFVINFSYISLIYPKFFPEL